MMRVMKNISYILVVVFIVAPTAGSKTFHVAFLGGGGDETLGEMGRIVLSNNGQLFDHSTTIDIDSPIGYTTTTVDSHQYKQTVIFENDCSGFIPNEVGISETGMRLTVADDALNLHVLQTYGDGVNPVDHEGYLAISDADLGMEYYTSTYCSTGGICQFAVTPIDDNTSVQITFPDTVTSDATCTVRKSGKKEIPFLLDEFQVLHFESEADLSGILIKASKNIAVFVGARNVPDKNGNSRTRLIEQIPPVNKWGTNFFLIPNIDNEAGDLIKIVTKTDNTEVTISGFSTFIVPLAGGSVERRVDKQLYSRVKANNPILIVQIMGINLYNQSTDVHSQPSMVLLQHTGQWIKGTTYAPCDFTPSPTTRSFILVATSDETFAQTLSRYNKFKLLYGGYKQLSYSVSSVNSGSASYGAIGVCHGKASFILKADWSEETDDCAPTTPSPGDDQDNNCDGQTDEHHCMENDRNYTFMSGYYDTHESTIGHIRIAGATTITFSVQLSTCNSIAYIHLRTDDEPTRHLSIQVASDKVSILCSNPLDCPHSDETFGSNCTERQQFHLNIQHDTSTGSTTHTLTFGTNNLVTSSNLYTEMLLMSNEQNTRFTVDLMAKDCGKIYSGEPDSLGRHFLAPLIKDYIKDFTIYITAKTTSADVTVEVRLQNEIESITVNAAETIPVSMSDLPNDDYDGIELHSDNEISVYVTQFSADGKVTGFKLIPVDVLGPRYHVFVDNSTATGTRCNIFSFDVPVNFEKKYDTIKRMDANSMLVYQDVTDENTVLQWVSRVPHYSSQYDSHGWYADQVIGPTNVYPQYGDIYGAWAPKIIDQHQFLELEFEEPVFVIGIEIYETYHAGGVKAVKGRTPTGEWQTMWKTARVENLQQSRIFSPPLSELGFRTRHIRLDIDCSVCGTWVEIDAVRLKGITFLTAGAAEQPILAQQPIAVFCGSMRYTLTQMPPIETLGTDFYIPPIPDQNLFSVMIKITTTEDSTNVLIEGDYHQLHTFDLKSTVFTREYVCLNFTDNSVWKIESTKPIQVVLEIQDLSSNPTWGSVVVIPPVNQYKNTIVFENITDVRRFGVDNQGTVVYNDQSAQQVHGNETFKKPTFVLTFINMTSEAPPHILVVPSDIYYKDENQICTLGTGEPGDGEDNDCDGLVDEENCAVTDILDSDLDGSLFEDCSTETRPVNNVQIHIPSAMVHCISPFAFSSTSPVTHPLEVNEAVPLTNSETLLSFDTFKAGHSPIIFPISSSSGSTDASSEPEDYCECVCPCAWTKPENTYTEAELLEKIMAIQKGLKIDKDSLSATIRKKVSAPDNRTPAVAVGYSGLIFLIVFLVTMVLLDVTSILRDARVGIEHVSLYFNP